LFYEVISDPIAFICSKRIVEQEIAHRAKRDLQKAEAEQAAKTESSDAAAGKWLNYSTFAMCFFYDCFHANIR